MNEDEKLIPDLKDWRKQNGAHFNIDTWTSIEGNIRLAIGYSFLFWPEFLEHAGCVFLRRQFSMDNFNHWANPNTVQYYSQVEATMNHFHISDLFSSGEVNEDQIKFLGNKLREIYSIKLQTDFPDKKFLIDFNDEDEVTGLEDYQLTFYQKINEDRKIEDVS